MRDFKGGSYHYLPVGTLHNIVVARGRLPIAPTKENSHLTGKPAAPLAISPRLKGFPEPKGLNTVTGASGSGHVHLPAGIGAAHLTPWDRFTAVRQGTSSVSQPGRASIVSGTQHANAPAGHAQANGQSDTAGHVHVPAGIGAAQLSPWDRFTAARNQTAQAASTSQTHSRSSAAAPTPTAGEESAPGKQMASSAWDRFGSRSAIATGQEQTAGRVQPSARQFESGSPPSGMGAHPVNRAPMPAQTERYASSYGMRSGSRYVREPYGTPATRASNAGRTRTQHQQTTH